MGQVTQTQTDEAGKALEPEQLENVLRAAQSSEHVSGLTHNFYRYPARFSPAFAKAVILAFSNRGETVFDPFMGGGTTLVEASAMGRIGAGTDINPLAVFVTRVKTTPLPENDLAEVRQWAESMLPALNLRNPPVRATEWAEDGYQRNISGRSTWPIRKTLELALESVKDLRNQKQQQFARCALLRTAQWALDCRTTVPSARQFRQRLVEFLSEMIEGARDYLRTVANYKNNVGETNAPAHCLTRSVIGVESDPALTGKFPPKLILTSPPYPGVHVLYHRWQIQGRRETPAPFWIIDSPDGNGASYYTSGDRKAQNLAPYYENMCAGYHSLARVSDTRTMLVQLVAFSKPSWQLPKYLDLMNRAGFQEVRFPSIIKSADFRIWRTVPHRKWYADQRGRTMGSNEVVLFHRLA